MHLLHQELSPGLSDVEPVQVSGGQTPLGSVLGQAQRRYFTSTYVLLSISVRLRIGMVLLRGA